MTEIADLSIFQKTLLQNFHVEGHRPDDEDHLPLALAGARQNAVYSGLLDKLGGDCDVDTASAILTEAAEKLQGEAEGLRRSGDPEGRWGDVAIVMGRLRQAASDVWTADSDRRVAAWK